jgi:hypothetical protein
LICSSFPLSPLIYAAGPGPRAGRGADCILAVAAGISTTQMAESCAHLHIGYAAMPQASTGVAVAVYGIVYVFEQGLAPRGP